MSKRSLRVVFSSDDEEEEQPPPPPQQHPHEDIAADVIIDDFQTVTLNSSNPTPNSHSSATTANTFGNGRPPPEPVPIDISDEGEDVINSGSTNNSNFDNANGSTSYSEVSDSPVNGVLERLGLRLRREWLESCLLGLRSSVPEFQGMDESAKAKFCFEQFLCSDMNSCGAGVLPPNVHSLHLVDLKGPFVLQVDEVVNVCCPLRGRYQNAAAGSKRCLKLSMTDGVQRVFGMEYRPIKDLEVLAPAGLKVAVCNVNVRRGLLMLVPEVLQVLGGAVLELEAARQRLVNEVNKPPRGKRTRTGGVPPLATRATHAAWPQHTDVVPQHVNQTSSVNTTPLQASNQGTRASIPSNDMHGQGYATVSRNNVESRLSARSQLQDHDDVQTHNDIPASRSSRVAGTGTSFGSTTVSSREDMGVPVSRTNSEPCTVSVVQPPDPVTIPRHVDELLRDATSSMVTGEVGMQGVPNNSMPGEDAEEVSMVDELDCHFMLSRDNEIPFTYLASFSAKFVAIANEAAAIRGKIKCFLTGVKGFQYKRRTTYELQVYVDDGSLISEILIDHNVVQKGIGYSPQEVTTALASSDTKQADEMKETLKRFQMFLVNFEGTMLLEMSNASPVPVAVEMSQGCPASDARLLLKRLKSFSSAPDQQPSYFNPVDLSP